METGGQIKKLAIREFHCNRWIKVRSHFPFFWLFLLLVRVFKKKEEERKRGKEVRNGRKTGNGRIWEVVPFCCFDKEIRAVIKFSSSVRGFILARHWSVIETRSNAAAVAVRHLVQQNFEHYNPVISERTRFGWRRAQLFPNYLFVRLRDQWRAVKSTKGVKDFLYTGVEKPARISDEVIAAIRSMENANGVVVLPKSKFKVGETVALRSSAGVIRGIYNGMAGADRAIVLLHLLGRETRLEVKEVDLILAA